MPTRNKCTNVDLDRTLRASMNEICTNCQARPFSFIQGDYSTLAAYIPRMRTFHSHLDHFPRRVSSKPLEYLFIGNFLRSSNNGKRTRPERTALSLKIEREERRKIVDSGRTVRDGGKNDLDDPIKSNGSKSRGSLAKSRLDTF